MNEILIKGGQLLLSLSILIVLHELGHFTAAKLFKVRVEKFYLFFNPWFSLFKFRRGETEYGMGWLPLGGYVKVSGIIDESLDREQMKQPPQPYELRSKPAWQRLIFMLGGIMMNVVLAIFIYWMLLYFSGEQYLPNSSLKYGIAVDSVGASIGLKDGDKILAVDGVPQENFERIAGNVIINMASSITVERDGNKIDIPITQEQIRQIIDSKNAGAFISARFPFIVDEVDPKGAAAQMDIKKGDVVTEINGQPAFYFNDAHRLLQQNAGKAITLTVFRDHHMLSLNGHVSAEGLLGVIPVQPLNFFQTKEVHYSFLGALPAGVNRAYQTLVSYIKQFALIFSPEVEGYKHVGGFITIAKIFPSVWDWTTFWSLTGFLSIVLAFINLLPIPALDGGHVLFTLIEMVTRRKPSDKFLEYAQIAGMIILLALMLFANGNDILKAFN